MNKLFTITEIYLAHWLSEKTKKQKYRDRYEAMVKYNASKLSKQADIKQKG